MNTLFKTLIIIFWMFFSVAAMAMSSNTNLDHSVIFQIIQNQIILDNSTIKSATIITSKNTANQYEVNVKLKTTAANKINDLTQQNMGKQVNIILNGKIISSATIQSPLAAEFLVTGLTKQQANQFIKSLGLKK